MQKFYSVASFCRKMRKIYIQHKYFKIFAVHFYVQILHRAEFPCLFLLGQVIVKFDTTYSKLAYLAARNSHYDIFCPKLKRNFAKILNLSFSV